jgi:hypothetical protein
MEAQLSLGASIEFLKDYYRRVLAFKDRLHPAEIGTHHARLGGPWLHRYGVKTRNSALFGIFRSDVPAEGRTGSSRFSALCTGSIAGSCGTRPLGDPRRCVSHKDPTRSCGCGARRRYRPDSSDATVVGGHNTAAKIARGFTPTGGESGDR